MFPIFPEVTDLALGQITMNQAGQWLGNYQGDGTLFVFFNDLVNILLWVIIE